MSGDKTSPWSPKRMKAVKELVKSVFQHVGPALAEVVWPEGEEGYQATPSSLTPSGSSANKKDGA